MQGFQGYTKKIYNLKNLPRDKYILGWKQTKKTEKTVVHVYQQISRFVFKAYHCIFKRVLNIMGYIYQKSKYWWRNVHVCISVRKQTSHTSGKCSVCMTGCQSQYISSSVLWNCLIWAIMEPAVNSTPQSGYGILHRRH